MESIRWTDFEKYRNHVVAITARKIVKNNSLSVSFFLFLMILCSVSMIYISWICSTCGVREASNVACIILV